MPDTVPVILDIEPAVAAALDHPRARAAAGRLLSRALRPHVAPGDLAQAIAEAKAEARIAATAEGDMANDAAPPTAAGKALAAEFRAFRRGRTLGGLNPKSLIREGLR